MGLRVGVAVLLGVLLGVPLGVLVRVELRVAEGVADRVQFRRVALADGVHVGVRMALVDGDEFRAEAEADDGDVDPALAHDDLDLVLRLNRHATPGRDKESPCAKRGANDSGDDIVAFEGVSNFKSSPLR